MKIIQIKQANWLPEVQVEGHTDYLSKAQINLKDATEGILAKLDPISEDFLFFF
jgi:hypothetical protein